MAKSKTQLSTEYRQRHRAAYNAYHRRWNKLNRDCRNEIQRKYRANRKLKEAKNAEMVSI